MASIAEKGRAWTLLGTVSLVVASLVALTNLSGYAAFAAGAASRDYVELTHGGPPHGALVHPRRIPVFGPPFNPAATYGFYSAVSPDGRNVYMEGAENDSFLSVLRRDPRTRRLRLLNGRGACIVSFRLPSRVHSCAPGPLGTPLAVTPDGRDLVLVSSFHGYVLDYRRTARTGALHLNGCTRGSKGYICGSKVYGSSAESLAVSPDGRNLYAVNEQTQTLTVLARDPKTGLVRNLAPPGGCVRHPGTITPPSGCTTVPTARFGPEHVVVSPDGRNVYVASQTEAEGDVVFGFARNPETGTLSPLPGNACLGTVTGICRSVGPLDAQSLSVSRDGRLLAVAGEYFGPSQSHTLLRVFRRNSQTGALKPDTPAFVTTNEFGPNVAIAADGKTIYLSGDGTQTLTIRANSPLKALRPPYGCLTPKSPSVSSANCTRINAPLGWSISFSSDGRSAYSPAYLLAFDIAP